MWMPNELEVFADYVAHARDKTTAGTELTRILIARSREQLELSRDVLTKADAAPKVWHPAPK
jgi:hypothetical protein